MTKQPVDSNTLRWQALDKIKQSPPADLSPLSAKNIIELVEELRLHQIELQLQNQELRDSRYDLEVARDLYQTLYQRYQTLYDFAPVGYFTLDRDGVILVVNLTGAGLLGTTKETLEKRRFTDYIARDSQDIFFQHRRKLVKTKTRQTCELELVKANGDPFYGRLESVVSTDDRSETPHIQTALIDITARKQAEAALVRYRDQLETEIERRKQAQATLQVNHEHLERALGELQMTQQQVIQQERLAAVGHLAAGIAHDFNNILTGLIGHAELLQMQPEIAAGSQSEQSVAIILKQAQRAAHLVRQILDFSRKSIRHPQPLELDALVAEATRFLERAIPENIQIRRKIEPGEYWVNADMTQLQQVLTNLAVNARDAMPEGGILTLSLAARRVKPAGSPALSDSPAELWFVLAVADTGSGISEDMMPHIFEPFFTTKAVGQGTGLGLAQVYGIIEQHAGYIEVASQPGQGTTFSLYLPPLRVAGQQPAAPAIPGGLPRGQGETVLVVEDEPTVLEVIQAMLAALNYQVLVAANGRESLAIYQDKKAEIALVLTDMVMPELDGLTLLQALQRENPAVRVIIMTGYPLGEQAEELMPQGMRYWLQKPPNLKRLAQALSVALKEE